MKKRSKVLWAVVVVLIVIVCAALGFSKANHSQPTKEKSTTANNSAKIKTSKTVSKASTNANQPANDSQKSNDASENSSDTKNSSMSNSSDKTSASQPSQSNVYYQGSQKFSLPTTDGVVNVTKYWPATMTIGGVQQSVVAAYARQGYFEVFTSNPTSQNYSFTYNGADYQKYIGAPNLDVIPKDN